MISVFVAYCNKKFTEAEVFHFMKLVVDKSCCVPDSNVFVLRQIDKTVDKDDIISLLSD